MSTFKELLGVDSKKVFSFFLTNLEDEVVKGDVRKDEMLYVAKVLAHYAQTSRHDGISMPAPANLTEVFDQFLWSNPPISDPEILEIGGDQTLLLAGFFRDQMARRHNLRFFYDRLGQLFYARAAWLSKEAKKRHLLRRMSGSFPVWAATCQSLSRTLDKNRFLLRLEE